MLVELKGTFRSMTEVQTIKGRNGTDYPKCTAVMSVPGFQGTEDTVALTCFGSDAVGCAKDVQPGQPVVAKFRITSREFNGRWYTDLDVWRILPDGPAPAKQEEPLEPVAPAPTDEDEAYDLPF